MRSFIFDVDGTLTPSRGRIDKRFAAWLESFATHNACYWVTGSDKPKTVEQLTPSIWNLAIRSYQCSGNDVWEQNNNIRQSDWKISDLAVEYLKLCLYESDWPTKTGKHIDTRPGMINFSVLGRNADIHDRQGYVLYDKKYSERNKIADGFNILFPDLQANIGGETGLDIGPKGSDKSQILKDFDSNISFFGDATFEGGNDYEIAKAVKLRGGKVYDVNSWEDTWEILKGL